MTVQLLLAPAGHGKTARLIERIRALPPLAPARVLVPDRIEATAFRRRLAQAGGALGVKVQTFYDLYADTLALAGIPLPPQGEGRGGSPQLARLPPTVRHRLILHLLKSLCDAGQLSYYAPLRRSPGFARLLAALFGELKRARIFPEDLERTLTPSPIQGKDQGGGPRLAELARLYTAYQSWLIDTGWVDAEGQGWLAAIALEREPTLLSDLSLLAVDGFDEFNPTQLHLLRLLARRADETLITLTGDPDRPDRLAHRRLARARAALTEALDVEPNHPATAPPPHPPTPAPLAHLEADLFEPDAGRVPAGDAVTFLEAQNRAAEAREALRWLKARIVREGVSLADAAIVARDVAPYRPFLEEAAAEFGMPLRLVGGADLEANPAIAALLNLLTLPLETVDWSPRALLDALSSPYFDWTAYALQPGDPDRLLDVARAGQVVSGLDQWRGAFRQLAALGRDDAPSPIEEEAFTPRRAPTGAETARLADVFESVVARVTPPPRAAPREWVAWLETRIGKDPTLEDVTYPDDGASLNVVARARENPATAERDVAALRALKDLLRGLVLADSVLGQGRDAVVSYGEFVAEIIRAVKEATYRLPAEGEALLVVSVLEARGLTFDSVALLGLAEGDFPQAEREDPLLQESDRAWLAGQGFPIEPRLRGDEAALFYQAVTRARRRLLLSRPYLAEDGQLWEPSPYWSAVQELFREAAVRHVRPTDPLHDPASRQELADSDPDPPTSVPESPPGDLSALKSQLDHRFGPDCPWSTSRLETYAKCPLYFWAAYALELEPRKLPEAGFDVLILGSIYHLVLERLYERVPDGDPDRLRQMLRPVAREVYDAAPHDYGFRPTPLWERQQEELTETLARTLEGLIEIAGEYVPTAPELAFGLRGKPPLLVPGEPVIRLRGYIDRVDRAPDGRLRVIDYKAGSSPISARELDEGTRLQLPLYALAAEEALGAEVESGFYWHIGSARPSYLRLEKWEGGVAGAVERALAHTREIVSTVRAGQFAPTPSPEGCPRFCPAAAFCEQFRARSW